MRYQAAPRPEPISNNTRSRTSQPCMPAHACRTTQCSGSALRVRRRRSRVCASDLAVARPLEKTCGHQKTNCSWVCRPASQMTRVSRTPSLARASSECAGRKTSAIKWRLKQGHCPRRCADQACFQDGFLAAAQSQSSTRILIARSKAFCE